MEINRSSLNYKEWLSGHTDLFFKTIHAITIYPYIVINIVMILASLITDKNLFGKDYEFWFIMCSSWLVVSSVISNMMPRWIRVYVLLIMFEVSTFVSIVAYYTLNYEKIFIIIATFFTFFIEFLLFEVNSWVIYVLQVKSLVLMLNLEILMDPTIEKIKCQNATFVLISLVMSLAVWAHMREKVLKEVFRYKQLIVKKQNNLETVLEHMPDGIVVLNPQNQAKLINDSLKRLLNIENRDQFYPAFKKLVYSEGRRLYPYSTETNLLKDVKDFISSGRSESVTFGVTEIDSRFYEWKGSISPWNDSKSLILLARDITALIELEKSNAIQVYQRAILRALSHELRTPLSVIISTSENIRSQSKLTDVLTLDKLSMISTNSRLLLNIINNLLDFVQITNNKFQLYNSFFNFKNLIQDTLNLFVCQATHKNILLSSSFDSNLPLEIFNDSNRIQQILINLLSNSLK